MVHFSYMLLSILAPIMARPVPNGVGNWQAELDNLLQNCRNNGLLDEFKSYRVDANRIKFIFERKLLSNIGWVAEYLTSLCQELRSKDCERAAFHRQEGNKLFVEKLDQQALLSYTKSLQFSPPGTKGDKDNTSLSLAYSNRSAVLFHLHKYQECLTDIERSLAAGFPEHLQHKLQVRQCLCYARLGQPDKASAARDEVFAKMQICDQKTAENLQREMTKITSELQAMEQKLASQHLPPVPQNLPQPQVSYGANSIVVQASSAVEMKTSPSQGRFLQARQDIKAGDTLIVERPFAGVLLPSHYASHCLHCFDVLSDNPVGCLHCSGVLYCDEACRDASWNSYHYIECRYMDLLHSVGIAHLALRIVLVAQLPFLTDFLAERKKTSEQEDIPGVTREGCYERNYLSVYGLMTHSADLTTDDLFQYSLTASILLGILIHSGWFNSSSCENVTKLNSRNAELKDFLQGVGMLAGNSEDLAVSSTWAVGGVLLRHVQQLVCNAHAITALHSTQVSQEHLVETQSQVRVATAIYPTASLMNHSCDPTIISSFQKDVLIVKSVKDVPAGGEIFNCYGPHCKRMKKQARQTELKAQYFFDCKCNACSTDKDDDSGPLQHLKCPACGKTLSDNQQEPVCPSCHTTVDMATVLSQLQSADTDFNEGVKLLEKGNHKKALTRFKSCLKVRSQILSSHTHDLGQVHDAIAQCLASTGCYAEACDYLTKSLAVIEAIFGRDSVELARELHKIAEVQIQAGQPRDALSSASRALDVAWKLFPESDEWIQELLCLKTALTKIIADGGM